MGLNAEEQDYINQCKARSHEIRHMMSTGGWKLFDGMLDHAEQNAYVESSKATDAWNGAKHHGAYHAVRYIRTWAARELDAIDRNIASVNESALQRDLQR